MVCNEISALLFGAYSAFVCPCLSIVFRLPSFVQEFKCIYRRMTTRAAALFARKHIRARFKRFSREETKKDSHTNTHKKQQTNKRRDCSTVTSPQTACKLTSAGISPCVPHNCDTHFPGRPPPSKHRRGIHVDATRLLQSGTLRFGHPPNITERTLSSHAY